MSVLRELEKEMEDYKRLLTEYPEKAKANKKLLIQNVEILLKRSQDYLESKAAEFAEWCNISVELFEWPENNIIQVLRKKFWMWVVNTHLESISEELERAKNVEDNFQGIKRRFVQYINMLH